MMDLDALRKAFGNHKRIPACYERVILEPFRIILNW